MLRYGGDNVGNCNWGRDWDRSCDRSWDRDLLRGLSHDVFDFTNEVTHRIDCISSMFRHCRG